MYFVPSAGEKYQVSNRRQRNRLQLKKIKAVHLQVLYLPRQVRTPNTRNPNRILQLLQL